MPGGYTVRVKTLTRPKYLKQCASHIKNFKTADAPEALFVDGVRGPGTGDILLQSHRTLWDRWQDFHHEYDHLVNDWRNWVDNYIVAELKAEAQRQAAVEE